jgi:hypothetical protein
MSGRLRFRLIASASALIASGALAASASASPAQAVTVGPGQYFVGYVFGSPASASGQSVIGVSCPSTAAVGNPLPDQSVEVQLLVPPIPATVGYTGDLATEINADLTTPTTGTDAIAIFTQYGVKLPIPTMITVPCSGTGTMSFNPDPDVDGSSFTVTVTFVGVPG